MNLPAYEYRIATIDDLKARWNRNIENNAGDNCWIE